MEAAHSDGSTNSKVIVQFTDPTGVFNDVAAPLQNRLPLGNLHWKSPTRPLRSIDELDVSLDREQSPTADGSTSTRRHQIPGLRQTPFVKVLLLRCDDKEKYKEIVRKEVKDWVKSLGFSTSGKATTKGQERHDAYEYIILHVVVPGTTAASQPKSSKHISVEASESTDSVNSKSKWTGKSTSTIYDKLRADFASSPKAPFERVAQIRLLDAAKPSTALSPLEIEQQWQDLVEKLKVAILQSFDARVAQYEEDIRERESQRTLPGWNFCTFFILKEGLARGFENVGLLEDALQVYEELDVELDAVIQDQAKEDYSDAANALLPYATDLKDTIRAVLDGKDSNVNGGGESVALSLQAWTTAESPRFPWRLERRNYQQMILTNQVSALDFRIYMFIRQAQIMLRRAGMSIPLPRSKSSSRQSGPRWDANLLSEICERSIKFMNLAARNLRQDLFTAWGGQEGLPETERKMQRTAIDNIVASWKWSSLLQTLSECQIISSLSSLSARANGDLGNGQLFSPTDIASVDAHQAAQSVSTMSSDSGDTSVNSVAPVVKDMFAALRIVRGSKTDLIFWAAELFTMLRTIFLQLCRQAHLVPYLTKSAYVTTSSDVDTGTAWTGILAPSLRSALHSEESALGAYRLLTVCACQCYTTAGKSRASRQLLFDLASLEAHDEDYEAAAGWLDAIPGFLDSPPRTSNERFMLELYNNCLRKLGRRKELVRSLFLTIRSAAVRVESGRIVQQQWTEMIEQSHELDPSELSFDAIFDFETLSDHVSHHDPSDLSTITLTARVLVPLEEIRGAAIQLICQSRAQALPAQMKFTYEGDVLIRHGCIQFDLNNHIATEGWYDAIYLTIRVGNIIFRHDFRQTHVAEEEEQLVSRASVMPPSFYMYPRHRSPSLQALHAPLVDLFQRRNVSIRLDWGSNDVHKAQLRLRPATAGARLDLLSARVIEGKPFDIRRGDDSHILVFDDVDSQSHVLVEIPYALDDASTISMSIRAELHYETPQGAYDYHDNLSIMTILPISVNVQDLFQASTTFSRFTFAPSRLIPISILDCKLDESSSCSIIPGGPWSEDVDAFPKQPVSWVVQIVDTKRHAGVTQGGKHEKLVLTVDYRCMDEVILSTIVQSFCSAIGVSEYAYATRPLLSHLRAKLQTLWTEAEIELATLTSEVELWSYEELDWTPLLYVFSPSARAGLQVWLRSWHEDNGVLPLKPDAAPARTLKLHVDPPHTDIVVQTQLKLASLRNVIVGQPVLAKLLASASMRADINAEITIEVPGQSDSWLVGGQRKANFLTSQNTFEGTVVLIAQKTGSLLLPSVEVRCRDMKNAGRQLAFEVDDMTAAVAVQVRSDVRSTTVGVRDGETAEGLGHWLIDSKRVDAA